MRKVSLLGTLSTLGAALFLAPLRSDGGLPCDNATTSLQSTINNPVAGDEKFFTLPSGPSNVMFLLDVSGSMDELPQCGDNGWGSTTQCQWPSWASVSDPTAAGGVTGNGTCSITRNASNTVTAVAGATGLAWMTGYDPTARALVDPGRGTGANGLVDQPTWGTGCTGNNCLFTASNVYGYRSWNETSATPSSCTVSYSYTDYNCGSNNAATRVTRTGTVTLPGCNACLNQAGLTGGPGFYFYSDVRVGVTVNVTTGSGGSRRCTGSTALSVVQVGGSSTVLFSGGWLNANPPKFMSARKVIKDVAWIDPNVTATTDQLRLGLSYLSSDVSSYSAAIIVPLGPSAADSYPVNPAAFVTARQLVLDALNHRNWPTTLPSLRSGATPMATALFHVGQYFTSPGTYTSLLHSSTWELPDFSQTTAGLMHASWVNGSSTSICWACQKSAIVIVTDGSPNYEGTLPSTFNNGYGAGWSLPYNCGTATTCPSNRCCSPSDNSAPSRVPSVGAWLYTKDLRPELDRFQNVVVSAVSFNLPVGNAQYLLQATANMSGGQYNNAADGAGLAAGVAQAISLVSNSSTAFGSPAATALTTINAVDTKAFVTRFKPNQKATWEGHVFEWMLFDEAAAGCDPTKRPNPNDATQQITCRGKSVPRNYNRDTTPDGYNVCTGSFLVDADCDEVEEDSSTGQWVKRGSGGVAAHSFFDAGQVLSTPTAIGYRTAAEHDDGSGPTGALDVNNIAPASAFAPGKTPRNMWAALPDGSMVELETKNAATLAPYMNLTQAWCQSMESLAKLCGASPLPACPVTTSGNWSTYCAQQVILFARGWDVMDQDGDGCAGPGNPSNGTGNTTAAGTTPVAGGCVITSGHRGEERDRQNDAYVFPASLSTTAPPPSFYKLGDVFHSSPVLVRPPVPESTCRLGTENQCVRTLFGYTTNLNYQGWAYQTPLDAVTSSCSRSEAQVDAYRAWRQADVGARENAVLVGSNDGFLHAFDAGGADTSVGVQDVDCRWPGTQDGTGEELWALIPADLLPKLKDTMLNHQYMVDGNVMVRDVWVDGVAGSGNALDGRKQPNEFKTVAIFGERSGGNQFTALDVTTAFGTTASIRPHPTVLWTFPPPRSDDAQYMGESWSDFAPRPPPIGPVRLVKGTGDHTDPSTKTWVEKWAVMINGGYDPTLTRGRAVWMLDVWTGSVLWRFTDTDFKTNVVGSAASTATSMFPVPAAVGMVDLGDPTLSPIDSDNFFDTATWGDMGGNLFVARFDQPGARGTDGRVTNWRAARTFEQGRRTDNAQYATNRTEFYYMTSNAWEPQRRALHTLVGSGNREQILEKGQTCGPDNLFSCCQAGCTVSSSSQLNYGVCSSSASFSCSAGQMTSAALTEGCGASGASACTGGASNTFTSTASYNLNCGTGSTAVATGTATCDTNGVCTVTPVGSGHDLTPSNASSCSNRARFYGIWAYGGTGVSQKAFSTSAAADWTTAQTFDANRFTDVQSYSGCAYTGTGNCSLVDTTTSRISALGAVTCASGVSRCQANVDDPGWFYEYNNPNAQCPTSVTCNQNTCTNEKTASGSTVLNSCASWNSFVPLGNSTAGGNTNPCSGVSTATQTANAYAAHFVSGTPDTTCKAAQSDTVIYHASQRSTIAPPAAPMVRLGVSATGQVYYSTLQLDPGGQPASMGLGTRDLASQLYWLPVSREAHNCRHVSNGNCE